MEWLHQLILAVPTGGGVAVGFGGTMWFIKWLLDWMGGRLDKKADRIDRSTQALLDRLEKEIQQLTERVDQAEADLADCKRHHAEASARVLHLEALLQAKGDAHQYAQLIIADERKGNSE